jgi:predicted DNA-binding protein with PD1-like motif
MDPFLVRLPTDADLLEALAAEAAKRNITTASIQVIGALEKAVLGYYHQQSQEYESFVYDEHPEIVSGLGNVSTLDGETFVHLHLGLSNSRCAMMGGHAMPGCIIFAAEAFFRPLPEQTLVRQFDERTGLKLWS